LKQGQAVIFDNKFCRHGRRGRVGDRLLLRVWIEDETG
jgi:alpha-ketoglutarate-dependent taurine dioxygenase